MSVEARDWVETTVRDAWRRYKYKIKQHHFLKYPNMTERLKHRPPKVPIAHFRALCEFWSKEPIQVRLIFFLMHVHNFAPFYVCHNQVRFIIIIL